MKKYKFRAYSNKFPKLFENEKAKLEKELSEDIYIEHVGSTAVFGLGGKGIMDILVGVKNKPAMDLKLKEIHKFGYDYKRHASTEDRFFLQKDCKYNQETIRYHLHLTVYKNKEWNSLIIFRDFLRNNPKKAKEYEVINANLVWQKSS